MLVVSIIYFLQRQTESSVEDRVIESGLNELGNQSELYFNLKNTGTDNTNYTYFIKYNESLTKVRNDTSGLTIPPGQTFSYTISIIRPASGVSVLNLQIYEGRDITVNVLLHNQTWLVKSWPVK